MASDVAVTPSDSIFRDALEIIERKDNESQVSELLQLKLDSQEKVKTCVDWIISEVLEEPVKHSLLAQLCKLIGQHKVNWTEDSIAKETTFQEELLSRCQYELGRVKKDDDKAFELSETAKVATTRKKKNQLEREHKECVSNTREKASCLFSFFGELFLVQMVPESMIHECVVYMLQSTSDNGYLESFCSFISTYGKSLDHPKAKARMDSYFERIEYILKQKKISLTVKLLLQEVQELRKNKWTKRQLHKAENPWVRSQLASKHPMSAEEMTTAQVFRQFQAILNKLTPQKFQRLAEQALELEFNTVERLKGCIDMIFSRVLRPEERKYGIAYANLCKVLSPLKVEWEEEGTLLQTNFRRELLTKLQAEFEKEKRDDEEFDTMRKAIAEAATTEERQELVKTLEESTIKARERSVSNIKFIGELFKLSMLSETIMHECIVRLLKSTADNESLECFAALITVTGKELDLPKAKPRMDGYFARVADIIKKGKTSTKIKFMLQDVQDLRKNDWVPRKLQAPTLRTIDQIHAEAKLAEEEELRMVAIHRAARAHTQDHTRPQKGELDRHRLAALKASKKASPSSATSPEEHQIQEMVKAILKRSVTGSSISAVYREDVFERRCAKLKKHVGENIGLQVQVLNALQVAVTNLEHPPRLLNQLFNMLYNIDIVEEEAFLLWRDEGTEGYGKAACIQSTEPFFEWLESASVESD